MTATVNAEQFRDPMWRLNNLYYIVDEKGRRTLFRPRAAQLDLIKNMHGKDIILKARQLGITTFEAIASLDECVWNGNWSAAIIADTQANARAILKTKVKFPYDNLPDAIKNKVQAVNDAEDTLALSNGSSLVVTSSARSGTFQRLHVSELGKIAARNPGKAEEIKSGSFPAAEHGHISIESTAEGQQGLFFDMVQDAIRMQNAGEPLTHLDFKLHFYPWHGEQKYRLDPRLVKITAQDREYFAKLKADGIDLDDHQKAWWVKTEKSQGGTMKREYPSTPQEAFEQALEGAYFEKQLEHSYKFNRIGSFPYDPRHQVNTFWDLGRNDENAIWLHQDIKGRDRFIGYYEASGEHISHYLNWLKTWAKERDAQWGDHFWPHDGDRQDLFLENGRMAVVEEMGFRPDIVPRVSDKMQAIEACRSVFPNCDFDETECDLGLKRLKHYTKEWDDRRGMWKDKPKHDINSNGADAFQTFARGFERMVGSQMPDNWAPVSFSMV